MQIIFGILAIVNIVCATFNFKYKNIGVAIVNVVATPIFL